jgi:hypothetical protein
MMERVEDDDSWRRPKLFLCGLQEFAADLNKRPGAQENQNSKLQREIAQEDGQRSQRLEKQKEKRECLCEVREDEYWNV